MEPARQSAAFEARLVVSAEIRALMGRYRVTQTALAQDLGMSQSSLSQRLSGSVPWDIDELAQIARRFRVPVSDLTAPIIFVPSNSTQVVTSVPYVGQMELFGDSFPSVAPPLELVKA